MFLRFEESTLHQSALQNVLYLKKNQFLAYKLSQHIALLLKKNAHMFSCFYVFMFVCFYVYRTKITLKFCEHEWIWILVNSWIYVSPYVCLLVHSFYYICSNFWVATDNFRLFEEPFSATRTLITTKTYTIDKTPSHASEKLTSFDMTSI